MKSMGKLLLGAMVGFVTAYGILSFSDFSFASDFIIIVLLVLSALLISMSLVRWSEVKKLYHYKAEGETEDSAEERKYKKFADYSLYTNAGLVLSLLALSLSAILSNHTILFIFAASLLIIHGLLVCLTRIFFVSDNTFIRNEI